MNPQSLNVRFFTRVTALAIAALLFGSGVARAFPVITNVVETGGDNEATDTITPRWTGTTLINGIAGEFPSPGITVPFFGPAVPSYVDRPHAWTNASGTVLIPTYLMGKEYILNGNDNRDNASLTMDISVTQPVRAYMMIDNRLTDANNANPPTFDATHMSWITNEGWAPMLTGVNRAANNTQPDEIGIDENGDGSINNWNSIYFKDFPAGTFRVKQADNAGQNMYGVVVAAIGPSTPPPAPTGLAAVNRDTQVILSWSPASTATGYNIKRSASSGGPYTAVGTSATTSFTDTGLVNNQDYFYVVSGTNVIGEGPNSAQAVGHPNPIVVGLTATGGTGQVALAWTAYAGALSYELKRSLTNGGPYTTLASGISGTSHIDTSVTGGTAYYYVVLANIAGPALSGQSDQAIGTTVPNPPSGLQASVFSSTGIKLVWSSNDVALRFYIERSLDGITFNPLTNVAGNVRTIVDGGLALNTTYYYRMQGSNSSGLSLLSVVVSNTTPTGGWNVNFASGAAPTPPGYVQDIGELFGDRTNGLNYGWATQGGTNIVPDGRWRQSATSPDLRYDTFMHMIKVAPPAVWEFQIPNGFYYVHIVSGDPDNQDSVFQFDVEGVITSTYIPITGARWGEFTNTCIVRDGRLTIRSGPNSQTTVNNNKINFIEIYPAVAIPVAISQQPQPQSLVQNRPLLLSVAVTNVPIGGNQQFAGAEPITYQWYRDGNLVPGLTNAIVSIPTAQPGDSGVYQVVITNYAGSVTSTMASVLVSPDTNGPVVVSIASLDGGTNIGICFDELLDGNISGNTASDSFNYTIVGGGATVVGADIRLDRRSVVLTLDGPVGPNFAVNVANVTDLAGNPINGAPTTMDGTNITGINLGLNVLEVGSPGLGGSHYVCDTNNIEIVGGGADIWGNSDQFRMVYTSASGDFDARVRVIQLAGSNAITKAVLAARQTVAADSAALHVSVNPNPPGRNQVELGARPTTAAATVSWGSTFIPASIPNSWMRITRAGNTFTGFRSTNGVDWIQMGQTAAAAPANMVVAIGVTAHDNTLLATGTFANFKLVARPTIDTQPASPSVTCHTPANFTVVASGPAEGGPLLYQWRFNGVPIPGATNASLTISDPNSANNGSYDVVVSNSAGSVTSTPAVLALPDTDVPAIACSPNITRECAGVGSNQVFYAVGASDNCDSNVTVVCVPASGTFFPIGATMVNCTATDDNTNSAMCSFIVTITDTTLPLITCPGDLTNNCTAANGGVVTFAPVASDCDTNLTVVCAPPSGSLFPFGTTPVTCTATDGSTNSSMCSFSVTVVDLPPTIVSCATNQAVCPNLSGQATVPDFTGNVVAIDPCSSITITQFPPAGTIVGLGTTNITLSVTDTNGGTSTCIAQFIVLSNLTSSAIANIANACPGTSATFGPTVPTGIGPFTYVWTKNGSTIPAANAASYTIPSVGAGDAATYCVIVTSPCGSVTNCATLTVAAVPNITAHPQSQATPMGNGVVFTVAATGVAPITYQWRTNGINVTGATATSLAISNLTLAQSGLTVAVVVSNCAGAVLSQLATLTVTPLSGISFDFNSPGQFTNQPYAMQVNNWLNTAVPPALFEVSTGGVGVATGSGALDLNFNTATENTSLLLPVTFDFSLTGKTLIASIMMKVKVPTATTRATQIGFVTTTNVNNAIQGINNNNGQGFMSVIMENTVAASVTPSYSLRAQNKSIAGTGALEYTPVNTPTNTLTTNNWYKLTAKFVNMKDAGILSSNFTVEASLQDMGLTGLNPGPIVLAFPPLLQTNDLVNQRNLILAVRGFENRGMDYWDNIYVHTVGGPPFFVTPPESQTVPAGRTARFRALVDGEAPYSYQWQKSNGVAGFTNIPGAIAWNLITDPLLNADNGAKYRVLVTGPAGSATSAAATVTVTPDPLTVVSAGSVDGCSVGIRFNQPVDPVTASNPSNYFINGLQAVGAQIYVSPTDLRNVVAPGARVVVIPATMFTGNFTVRVTNVLDLSGNPLSAAASTALGSEAGLTGVDINPYFTSPVGQQNSFAPGQFEVSGGGADIWDRADSFRYVYTQKTGDFDVLARIPHVDMVRTTEKAGFDVRTSLDPFSPQVLAAVNPQLPGRNFIEGTVEANFNVLGASWGNTPVIRYPDVWLRMRRAGNTFLRYSSTNGVSWQFDGQTSPSPALPQTVYFGLAVCAAGNQNLATAWFENYSDFPGYTNGGNATINITQQPANVTTGAPNAALVTVIATLTGGGAPAAAGELIYLWQRDNGAGGWTNMPNAGVTNNILNTGPLFGSDNGAQYRVIVSAPGATSMTSSPATVTVTDSGLPTVTSALIPTNAPRQIIITYSEPMAASAIAPANYTVTNGPGVVFAVSSATFLSGDPRVVMLTTANPLPMGPYGVVINGPRDLNNNALAANTVRLLFQVGSGRDLPIVVDFYGGLATSGSITDLVNNLKFAGGSALYGYPDFINYSNVFGINPLAANFPSTLDQYGVKLYTYFVPTNTGPYKFYVRADDFAQFWMNTNANPAISTLPPDVVIPSFLTSPPAAFGSPQAEQAPNAFDDNANTKYLNTNNPSGVVLIPGMGSSVVTGLRLTTANDAPERDPITFRLEGTTNNPATGPWSIIVGSADTGLLPVTGRFTAGPIVNFANTTPYTAYRLVFLTVRTAQTLMQVAEIELLDASNVDVTGRGARPQVVLGGNSQVYTAPLSVTNFLNAGQKYYMELRFKESTGGDGGTVAIRTGSDTGIPAQGEVIPASLCAFPSPIAPPTPVQVELYTGLVQGNRIGNGRIEDLIIATNLPNFVAQLPNITGFEKSFGYSTNVGNTSIDNYLGRLYAYYVAPSNGLYKFHVRSDDSSQLWMNTNAVDSTDPRGMSLLGYTERFINGNYWLVAENVSLNAGQRYYLEGRWREGTGGDGMTVAIRSQGDSSTPPATESIPASQLELATNVVRFGPASVLAIAPLDPVVTVGQSIVFQAFGIGGTPPYGFFWLKNGVQIMAGNPIFTNQPVTLADDQAIITLVVTNPWSRAEVTSRITVQPNTTPPVLVSAIGSQYQEFLTVTYDEPVDPLSASCVASYQINNGVSVRSIAYDNGNKNRVTLRTSPQTPGQVYTLTVNGVRNLAGVPITPNTMTNFTAWTWGGCGFLVETFKEIPGGAVDNLVKDFKYINNFMDGSHYTNLFGAGQFGADSGLNNYGARVSAYALPPNTGLYRFYVRGDDGTQLFMNTNGPDARARVMIARNDAANSATNLTVTPQLSPYQTGLGLGTVGASISPIISLTNGTGYYIEALMKEGGGGDHLEVIFRPVDPGTLQDVPPLQPVNAAAGDLNVSFAQFFAAPGSADTVKFDITQSPPTDLFLMEGDPVSLVLDAVILPPSAALATCFQWQRESLPGSGVFANIAGAILPSLPSFAASMADDGRRYRLLANLPAPRVFTTTLHIMPNTVAPFMVAASSLNGTNIDICYNEYVDPNSAVDDFNYSINGGMVLVRSAQLRPDGRTVSLAIDTVNGPAVSNTFVVTATGISDIALLNSGDSSATGMVQGYVPLDVGGPPGGGSSFSCRPGEIDVIAGGADIWGTADQGHLTLRPILGDFDVWTRVQRLDRATADNDGITKGGIMVRETFAPDSRKLHVLVEPPAVVGGRDLFEAGRRRATGGGDTVAWDGGNGNTIIFGPAGIPNAWIRVKRTGNLFEAFRSADGINWTLATTNNVVISNTVLVGLGTTAHIPSPSAATTYAEYRNIHIPNPPTFIVSPANANVAAYDTVTFTSLATNPPNSGPLKYKWQRNGSDIPGATSASYSIPGADVVDTGAYTVLACNDGGCSSATAYLTVNNLPPTVANDMVMATQNVSRVVSVSELLGNDPGDPESYPVSLLGVSGVQPGIVNANFEDGLVPPGAGLFGTPLADPGAHIGDDGTGTNKCVHLTDVGIGSAFGALLLPDTTGGKIVNALEVRWRNRIGGAANNALQFNRPGADGMSFSWGADVPVVPGNTTYEDGQGTGLIVAFDTWDNGGFEAPSIEMRWQGVVVARDAINSDQGLAKDFLRKDQFVDVSLSVTPQGVATLVYDGMTLSANLPNYGGVANGRFLFGARTGGAFDNHWIDDVSILAMSLETSLSGPSGTTYGNAYVNNGVLHLTDNANNLQGSYVSPQLTFDPLTSLTADFKVRIGGGTARPADGLSFSLAPDLPAGSWGEEGAGSYLTVSFDSWDNNGTDTAPSIDVKFGGVGDANIFATRSLAGTREAARPPFNDILTNSAGQQIALQTDPPAPSAPTFVPVHIQIDPDGTLDLTYKGVVVFTNLPIPGFFGASNLRAGFGARTGGANDNNWVDDVAITINTTGSPGTHNANFNSRGFGTVMYDGTNATYTPPLNTCGPDSWYYVATDGQLGGIAIGRVDVVIKESTLLPPVIVTCPTNRTYNLTNSCDIALPNLLNEFLATDNCCCLVITQSPPAGTILAINSTTMVTFTATDTAGQSTSCSATIQVRDTGKPVIVCPGNIIAECSVVLGAPVSYTATTTDACDPAPSLVCTPPSGSVFLIGTNTVTCTSVDASLNTNTCSFTVTVRDTTPPSFACPTNNYIPLGSNQCSAVSTYVTPTLTDCDPAATIVCSPPSGTTFPSGTNVIVCVAGDTFGNTNTCAFLIQVIENVKPALVCPPDLTVECGDSTVPPATGMATATDNCDTNPVVSRVDGTTYESYPGNLNGWSFSTVGAPATTVGFVNGPGVTPLGTGSLRFTIDSDGDGVAQARNTLYHNVRLSDLTELSFRTYRTSTDTNESVYLVLNVDTDGDSVLDDLLFFEPRYQGAVPTGVWQNWDAMSGGWHSLNHPVIMSAGAGVRPLSVYIAAFPNAKIANTTSGAGGVRLVAGLVGVWENFDGNVDRFTIGASGVSRMNDFDLTPGDAGLVAQIVRTWTAIDDSGNQLSCSQLIRVIDTVDPTITCPANLDLECDTAGGRLVTFSPTAADVCDSTPTVVCTPASGSHFPIGLTTVNCTATDDSGNSESCSFTVRVRDTTPPVIVCSPNLTNECTGPVNTPVTFTTTATDICDTNLMVICTPASGSPFPAGTTTVNCMVTDMSTNSASCSFTVTIVDQTPPVITACVTNVTVPANASCEGTVPDLTGLVTANDLCGGVIKSQAPSAGTLFATPSVAVLITVTDSSGNSNGCIATVTRVDVTPPVVTCPSNLTAECVSPTGAPVTFTATATDACSGSLTPVCTPASGSVFPMGVQTVTCRATDTAGNSNSCTFTVTVVDTTAPFLCTLPPTTTGAGGTGDNFAGPEPSSPSPDLSTYLFGVDFKQFDEDLADTFLAHSFVGLPENISSAKLRIRMRAGGNSPEDDTVTVGFVETGGFLRPERWSRRIGTTGTPGLIATPWSTGTEREFVLDLTKLPNTAGPNTDLLTVLNERRHLDLYVQDDTMVDYMTLEITTCQCRSNIVIPRDAVLCGATPTFTTPVFSDLCDPTVTVTCSPPSGSLFPVGMTIVTCSGVDDSGNRGTCSFRVTVTDSPISLTISRSGSDVIIKWPVTCADYILEGSPALPATWTTVNEPVGIVGGMYQVTVPASGQQRYFRLRR